MQIQREGTLFERLTFDDLTTTGNAYVNVPFHFPTQGSSTRTVWRTEKIISKIFNFKATTNDLNIKILASDDEGDTFPIIAHAETLVAVGSPVRVVMGNYYGHLKIQVKPAVEGAHGTLSVEAYGFSNPNMTDVEISADTSGLATSAKQDTSKGILDNIEDGIDELKVLVGEVQASPTENSLLERVKVLGTELNELEALIGEVQASPTANTALDRLKTLAGDLDAIQTQIGEVQASPTSNTVLDRLKAVKTSIDALLSGVVLAAGTNVIGRTGAKQFSVTGNFSRPADTTAYAAGDAVTNSTSAPTVLELALDSEGAANAQDIMITGAQVVVGSKWASIPTFNLWIANATFAATNDNSALSIADETARGAVMIPLEKTGYTGANSRAQSEGLMQPFRLAAADKSLFVELQSIGAPTPVSEERFDVVIWGYLL